MFEMSIDRKNAIVILLWWTVFNACYANQLEQIEEILRFCNDNGHRNVAIMDQSALKLRLFLKSPYNLRARLRANYKAEDDAYKYHEMDTLIVQKDTHLQFEEILNIFSTRKRKKSILVMKENEVEEFRVRIRVCI